VGLAFEVCGEKKVCSLEIPVTIIREIISVTGYNRIKDSFRFKLLKDNYRTTARGII